MRTIIAVWLLSVAVVAAAEPAPASIPHYLKGHEEIWAKDPRAAGMEWFKQAEFGMFVSFSPASQVGQDGWLKADADWANNWHGKNATLPQDRHDRYLADMFDGQLMSPSAEAILRRFTAKGFDADRIADLAVAAGMKYILFTTHHVLGRMYLFQTETSPLHSGALAPQRDFVAELAKACQARNLGLFLYVGAPYTSPVIRERYRTMLFAETSTTMLHRKGYKSAELWFDQPGAGAEHKTASDVLAQYQAVRKRNQNFVLNIAPRGDGSIHPADERVLREVGQRIAALTRPDTHPASSK